jgi:hypothetical protein
MHAFQTLLVIYNPRLTTIFDKSNPWLNTPTTIAINARGSLN